MKRAMIFIDGSNVYHDWTAASAGKQMDIEKYINVVKSKFVDMDFIRTYYFTSATSTNKAFLHKINTLPYCEVITGRLQDKKIKLDKFGITCSSCGMTISKEIMTQVDKGTDVNIAVEMLRHGFNHTYDTAILISRDADFASVVKIIKTLGCNVELVLFETSKSFAQELTDCVDHVVTLDTADRANCEQPVVATATSSSATVAATALSTIASPAI